MKTMSLTIIGLLGVLGAGCAVQHNSQAYSAEKQALEKQALEKHGTEKNPPYSQDVWPENVVYQQPMTQAATYSSALTVSAIAKIANQVADWQLSQYDIASNKMRPEERASAIPQGWIYATQNIGMLQWGLTRNDPRYVQAVRNMSAVNEWRLGPRFYHADDHAMGSVYMDLYQRYQQPSMIADVQKVFDWVLDNPSQRSFEFEGRKKDRMETAGRRFFDPWCTERWCWADAIFMAPPVWAQLSEITGDTRYIDFMDKEFWATTDYLYNKDEHLYLRDSRYFTLKDDNGKLIYWGRGNGWVLAGIARLLPFIPSDFATRGAYETLFKNMSAHIKKAQNPDGSWPSSLLDTTVKPTPESSGTALLAFGLAWGVNNGLLEATAYKPVIERAWQSLVASVDNKGRLGWVQQVAFAPGSATAKDTELYGTGAFLLAASEITKMLGTD